jgi:serine/threonine protein phosphatase PrpC
MGRGKMAVEDVVPLTSADEAAYSGGITHAVAQDNSSKGEDFHATSTHSSVNIFAVFDGHSGHEAAEYCSEHLCADLLEGGAASLDKARLVDAIWRVDEHLGSQEDIHQAGTTCTVLLTALPSVSSEPAGGSLHCLMAWVGDSTAVTFDMRSRRYFDFACTSDHSPTDAAEAAAVAALGA